MDIRSSKWWPLAACERWPPLKGAVYRGTTVVNRDCARICQGARIAHTCYI